MPLETSWADRGFRRVRWSGYHAAVPRILHVLSQRPARTGSGVTLDALVRHAATAGWDQRVACGVPTDDPEPEVGGLPEDRIHPVLFGTGALPFPVPGMSDVMPYPSTRWSAMSGGQLDTYRRAWDAHLRILVDRFQPDVIHAHHLWIVGSMLKDVAPETPVVSHCHATGFRQMELCPALADDIALGVARNERFAVLHAGHATELAQRLRVSGDRIHVVGAGYRDDLFHVAGRDPAPGPRLVYVGKYAHSKGLPWLLDAVERLATRVPELELHVAGSGAGEEAEALSERMRAMAPTVVRHGALDQPALADLMRRCAVCVLPSFYEGLPLVLVEAAACGCRLVATDVAGVTGTIAPRLGGMLEVVPRPRLEGPDTPMAGELPAFVAELEAAVERALNAGPVVTDPAALAPFTWAAVYGRVESVWHELLASDRPPMG
jgi:glycosyltransferase involved in cell wall biosynthesis